MHPTAYKHSWCKHPNCSRSTNRNWCGRHWGSLSDDFKRRWRSAKSGEEKGALRLEAEEYFRSRMIGQHEITTCRGPDCSDEVVWLKTVSGKSMLVNADGVTETDTLFDKDRHVAHWATCPDAEDFRR